MNYVKPNRTLSLCFAIALSAALAIGGSTAYLTSTDSDYNTMTVGTVRIDQIEQQRGVDADGNPTLESFAQDKDLRPAYYDDVPTPDGSLTLNGEDYPIYDNSVAGEVDKIVTVKNEGLEEAYVRTIIAFEHTDPNGDGDFTDGIAEKLHILANGTDWNMVEDPALDHIKIGDNHWQIYTFIYGQALPKGMETAPSLMQVYLDKSVTVEELEAVKGKYEIVALSQAVQTQMGTLAISDALDEAFGPVDEANVQAWFLPLLPTTTSALDPAPTEGDPIQQIPDVVTPG